MYFVYRIITTPFAEHTTYLAKTPSQSKAEWLYDEFVGNSDVAISYKFSSKGDKVSYGYDYIPDNVPTVNSLRKFAHHYENKFNDKTAKEQAEYKYEHTILKRVYNMKLINQLEIHDLKKNCKDKNRVHTLLNFHHHVSQKLNQISDNVTLKKSLTNADKKIINNYSNWTVDHNVTDDKLHQAKKLEQNKIIHNYQNE